MADFSELKAAIRADIKDNTHQAITGGVLQEDLLRMVDDINASKQDRIEDLDAIREGAAAGSTAYQEPEGGIPAEDLAENVKNLIYAGL